jgi:hypothetical protein
MVWNLPNSTILSVSPAIRKQRGLGPRRVSKSNCRSFLAFPFALAWLRLRVRVVRMTRCGGGAVRWTRRSERIALVPEIACSWFARGFQKRLQVLPPLPPSVVHASQAALQFGVGCSSMWSITCAHWRAHAAPTPGWWRRRTPRLRPRPLARRRTRMK